MRWALLSLPVTVLGVGCMYASAEPKGPQTRTAPATTVTVPSAAPDAAAPSPAPAATLPPSGKTRIVATPIGEGRARFAVWSVSADGAASTVAVPEAGLSMTTGREGAGSDGPLPAPDGKRVAYLEGGARGGTLVVRDLEGGAARTVLPRQPRSEVLLTSWSTDGKRLLYTVAPFDGPRGVLANPDGSILAFFVHDVGTQATEAVPMPCEFQAWLASGEFLVSCDGSSVLKRVRGKTAVPLPKKHERYSQASVAESGTIAVVAQDKDGAGSFSQVIAIDPVTFSETVVSERGKYGQFQFPKASPSGKHVGYSHHVPIGGGRYRMDLVVDRKTVSPEILDFVWIDDDAVAIVRPNEPPKVVSVRSPSGAGEPK